MADHFRVEGSTGIMLDGDTLRTAELPTVRKGGYDTAAVARLLHDAAAVIDALHLTLDEKEQELVALHEAADGTVKHNDAEEASTLLVHAQTVAEQAVRDAHTDAARVRAAAEAVMDSAERELASAHTAATAVISEARTEAEEQIAGLHADIERLRAQRAHEEGELETQLARYRDVAGEVHQRLIGQIQAALSLIEGYVSEEPPAVTVQVEDGSHDEDAVNASAPVNGSPASDPVATPETSDDDWSRWDPPAATLSNDQGDGTLADEDPVGDDPIDAILGTHSGGDATIDASETSVDTKEQEAGAAAAQPGIEDDVLPTPPRPVPPPAPSRGGWGH